MKFNLKSHPKPKHLNTKALGLEHETWLYSTKELDEWFEGFEKELREKLASLDKPIFKGSQGYDVTRTRCNLKEILGE